MVDKFPKKEFVKWVTNEKQLDRFKGELDEDEEENQFALEAIECARWGFKKGLKVGKVSKK